MNITASQVNISPLSTVYNPQSDNLRRENNLREVITPPAAAQQSAAEKGVASDKDKAKTPAQNNEQTNVAENKKQSEIDNATISDQSNEQSTSQEGNQQNQSRGEKNPLESFADEQLIKELKLRDQEVRAHELAHAAVGGQYTGAPSYEFTVGPDGKKYATSGEVSVDLSIIAGDPQATITKLQKVHAAALAPANPSIQDTRVAAQASRLILQAQSELLAQKLNKPELAKESSVIPPNNDSFYKTQEPLSESYTSNSSTSNDNTEQYNDFDSLINKTIAAQGSISVLRDDEVTQRQTRIENFYNEITKAYDKPAVSNLRLNA